MRMTLKVFFIFILPLRRPGPSRRGPSRRVWGRETEWGGGVEGWWGFPVLEINKFVGFLVPWFSCFVFGVVSWFQVCTKFPFLVPRKILARYPSFSSFCYTDLWDCSMPIFSSLLKQSGFPILYICKTCCFVMF